EPNFKARQRGSRVPVPPPRERGCRSRSEGSRSTGACSRGLFLPAEIADPTAMPDAANSQTATLLVSCPDQRGIVAALAQLLYGHGANILDADQHTDAVAGIFFQRIHFDASELRTDRTSLEAAIAEVAGRLRMTWRLCDSAQRKRVAIFVSRTDHCLYDLLLRHRSGEP